MSTDKDILELLRTRKFNDRLTKEEENRLKELLKETKKNG
jgi:hypothetical protein